MAKRESQTRQRLSNGFLCKIMSLCLDSKLTDEASGLWSPYFGAYPAKDYLRLALTLAQTSRVCCKQIEQTVLDHVELLRNEQEDLRRQYVDNGRELWGAEEVAEMVAKAERLRSAMLRGRGLLKEARKVADVLTGVNLNSVREGSDVADALKDLQVSARD